MGFYSDLMGYEWDVPSGNLTDRLKMTIEIVDFLILNGEFPQLS